MPSTKARATYRHGDLRSAAIAEAYDRIAEVGHEALSLRKVADAVGVAHRSLYNHFADRDALLDAVAAEGYSRLADRLRRVDEGRTFVEAYVGFALGSPAIYALMTSRPHATMKERPVLQAAVHEVIGQAMRHFSVPESTPEEKRRAVMKVYIMLHGALTLHASGILDVSGSRGLIEELVAMTDRT